MKPLTKAVAVAVIHVLLVCSLGAKLLYDRSTRPHVWLEARNYASNLSIRDRYIRLQFLFADPTPRKLNPKLPAASVFGRIEVRDGGALVQITGNYDDLRFMRISDGDSSRLALAEPLAYFIPDTAQDPSHLKPGETLWVDATIPKKGPPRPIRLGLKQAGSTEIVPLAVH